MDFGSKLEVEQSLAHEGSGEATVWPRGVAPGQTLAVKGLPLWLQPGGNRAELSWSPPEVFPGGVAVMLCRMWGMEGAK